ncbi:5337_t:CDS:2, partial [Rhizophagus irregularis]
SSSADSGMGEEKMLRQEAETVGRGRTGPEKDLIKLGGSRSLSRLIKISRISRFRQGGITDIIISPFSIISQIVTLLGIGMIFGLRTGALSTAISRRVIVV